MNSREFIVFSTFTLFALAAHAAETIQPGDHLVIYTKACGFKQIKNIVVDNSINIDHVAGTSDKSEVVTSRTITTTQADEYCTFPAHQDWWHLRRGTNLTVVSSDASGNVSVVFNSPPDAPKINVNSTDKPVEEGVLYTIPAKALDLTYHGMYGWTTGLLVVPMKVVKGSIEPGGSLGPYIGYHFAAPAVDTAIIVSGGPSINKNSKTTETDSTATKAGVYLASGFIVTIFGKPKLVWLVAGILHPGTPTTRSFGLHLQSDRNSRTNLLRGGV